MATPSAPVTNTKQEILDAANELAAVTSEGQPLRRLCAALAAEMERQIAFDTARASATVPPAAAAAAAPATTTTPTSSASSTPAAPAAAGGAGSSHA